MPFHFLSENLGQDQRFYLAPDGGVVFDLKASFTRGQGYNFGIMLKILAILAVLLVVGQAGAPVPRETTDPKGNAVAGKDTNAREPQKPPRTAASVASVEQVCRPTFNCNPAKEGGKDAWDKAAVLANYFLIAIGVVGIYYGKRTFGKLKEQTTSAQAVLIATQRPRVVVKRISLIPGKLVDGNGGPTLQEASQWRISCVIANVGASKALIVKSNLTISRLGVGTLKGLLPSLPVYGKDYSFGEFSIEAGERQEKIVVLQQQPDTAHLRILCQTADNGGYTDTSPLICFGFFHYRDLSGVGRLTGFGAQFHPKDMSSAKLDSPEYEYCD